MESRVNKHGKHACACCGYFTITEIFQTCPVCCWNEDFYQEEHIDDNGGPNTTCLRTARENFLKFGVKNPEHKNHVRSPKKDELGLEHTSPDHHTKST